MTLRLEEGVRYKTRRGLVVGPLTRECDGNFSANVDGLFRVFFADGRHSGGKTHHDLVEKILWDGSLEPVGGRKDDTGKDPWRLFPWDAARGIIKVLAFGAGKYSERNWETGMDWSRPFDACIRHLTAWWEGEKADPETGYSHLWHAGCCILFLIAYEIRGVGKDNRPARKNDA